MSAARPGHLVATGLEYRAGGRLVLDGVSLAARGGEALSVSGPSGSGKTTLLLTLAGILTPTSGEVTWDGASVSPGGHPAPGIALVLQTYGLSPVLTAAENVALPLQARGLDRAEIRRRCADTLSRVGLAGVGGRPIGALSGGQQQRVAVARALALHAAVLLADEPTSQLDAENRARILDLVAEVVATGAVVILASHDPAVDAACTHHVRLADGKTV